MKLRYYFFYFLSLIVLYSCKKKEELQVEAPLITTPTQPQDLGIKYSSYTVGNTYFTDTFQTKFTVSNYGPNALEAGDTVLAAVEINKVVYSLTLIGSGPTNIIVPNKVDPNQSFEYNPGYLLKTPTLAYYNKDTLDITLLMYGKSGSPVDKTFPIDPTPKNNSAILRLTQNNFFVLQ